MPVHPYHSQKEAPPEAEIWRFLDLRKFRDLMANQELYFRRADLFDDETEGLPPDQYARGVLGLDPFDVEDEVDLNNHLGTLAQGREMYFITCWQLFQKESLSIWEQYGHDGVALVSTYGRLKEILESIADDTHIGLVQYGNAHFTGRFNALEFITTKQERYSAECEVRAILVSPDPLDGGNRHIGLDGFRHRRPLEENPRHPWVHECKRRRISLQGLVQAVVVSPWAEADAIEEIKEWTRWRLSIPPKDSGLRGERAPTLDEYRNYRKNSRSEPRTEKIATPRELKQYCDELTSLKLDRVRFLYNQWWEKCRLETDGLPSALDVQYLEVTLRVLKDLSAKQARSSEG